MSRLKGEKEEMEEGGGGGEGRRKGEGKEERGKKIDMMKRIVLK